MSNKLVWLFDLDNTLHNADIGIFQIINNHMTEYLSSHLSLSWDKASKLRKKYWDKYGATIAGLRIHHPHISIDDFLRFSHPEDLVNQSLVVDINLHKTLSKINGTRVVFSNGPSFYARNILRQLSIDGLFSYVFGCDDFDYFYKPNIYAYQFVCKNIDSLPEQCVMVDDSLANLFMAKNLGMQTILFGANEQKHQFVDYVVSDWANLFEVSKNFVQ
ncbi:MAG: pyrimidine 5'-nucleotidase [Neisseriaceae bacterium]|nr:pyrimidine 5'-nucleotidase [Neisseriaceae bacterium]